MPLRFAQFQVWYTDSPQHWAMMENIDMHSQDEFDKNGLGYTFHPRLYSHAPGHPQLDIVLRAKPTERHFDPVRVRLTVAAPGDGLELVTIWHHPESSEEHHRVCAGFVAISDRRDKRVEAFTFGGDLHVTPQADLTLCVLTSPAPIIEILPQPLTHGPSVATMLVDEVEALIARRRAAWEREQGPDAFDKRLAATDPFVLYLACLQALNENYAHLPHQHQEEDTLTQEFVAYLQGEIKTLDQTGKWPPDVPPLAKLL